MFDQKLAYIVDHGDMNKSFSNYDKHIANIPKDPKEREKYEKVIVALGMSDLELWAKEIAQKHAKIQTQKRSMKKL